MAKDHLFEDYDELLYNINEEGVVTKSRLLQKISVVRLLTILILKSSHPEGLIKVVLKTLPSSQE